MLLLEFSQGIVAVDASIDGQDIVQLSRCIVQARVPALYMAYESPAKCCPAGRMRFTAPLSRTKALQPLCLLRPLA